MDFYKSITTAAKEAGGQFVTVSTKDIRDFIKAADRGFVAFRKQFAVERGEPCACTSCDDERCIDLPIALEPIIDRVEENLCIYTMACPDCAAGISFKIDGYDGDFELFVAGRDDDSVTFDVVNSLWKITTVLFGGEEFDATDKERIAAVSRARVIDYLNRNGHPKDEPDEMPLV